MNDSTPNRDGTRVDQATEDSLRRHRPGALPEALRSRILNTASPTTSISTLRHSAWHWRQWCVAAAIALMTGVAGMVAGLSVGRQQGAALAMSRQPNPANGTARWAMASAGPTSAGEFRRALSQGSLEEALEAAAESLPRGSPPMGNPLAP